MSITLPESVPIPKASLLEVLGRGLGGGIQSGMQQAAPMLLSGILSRSSRLADEQNKMVKRNLEAQNAFQKMLKSQDLKILPEELSKYNQFFTAASQRGIDPLSLIDEAYNTYLSDYGYLKDQKKLSETLKEIPEEELADEEVPSKQLSIEEIKALPIEQLGQLKSKDISHLPFEERKELADLITNRAKTEANRALARGAIPGYTFLERKLKEKGLISEEELVPKGTQRIGEIIGAAVPITAMGKGIQMGARFLFPASRALQIATEIGGWAVAGSAYDALEKFEAEGRGTTPKELLKSGAFWGGIESVLQTLPYVGKFAKNIIRQAKKAKPFTGEAIAKTINSEIESIVKNAKPIKEVPSLKPMAEKVKAEAPRETVSKKDLALLEKTRREKVKDISKSPLEEYYAPPKEVAHRPETIMKERARLDLLDAQRGQIRSEIKDIGSEIAGLERDVVRASKAEASNLRNKLEDLSTKRERLVSQVKDIEFEMRHKKPAPTSKEISDQIEKSFTKMREEIRNPEKFDAEKFKRQAQRDAKAIATAESILKRGKMLSPKEMDTFIAIREAYQGAYEDLINQNKKFIAENLRNKSAQVRNKVAEARKMNEMLESRIARNKADIVRQKDKKAIKKMLEGPKGSFYRNELKKMRKDVEAFQKDIFKHYKRIMPTREAFKAKEIGLKTFDELKSAFENYSTNPKAAAEKLAQETGMSSATAESIGKEANKKASDAIKDIKAGKDTAKTERAFDRLINSIADKLPIKNKKIARDLARGIVVGISAGILDEILPKEYRTTAKVALGFGLYGRGTLRKAGAATPAYGATRYLFNKMHEIKMRMLLKARKMKEANEYLSYLKKHFGPKRANETYKKALEKTRKAA